MENIPSVKCSGQHLGSLIMGDGGQLTVFSFRIRLNRLTIVTVGAPERLLFDGRYVKRWDFQVAPGCN